MPTDTAAPPTAEPLVPVLSREPDELHLGVATVKTHVGQLFSKLEAANRVQVARWVHDAGLA